MMFLFKNFDTGAEINLMDLPVELSVPSTSPNAMDDRERCLRELGSSWLSFHMRQDMPESVWVQDFAQYLDQVTDNRIGLVRAWLEENTIQFKTRSEDFTELWREFNTLSIAVKEGVNLCRSRCHDCQLLCLRPRAHSGSHDCETSHRCAKSCAFHADGQDRQESQACSLPYVYSPFLYFILFIRSQSAGHEEDHMYVFRSGLCMYYRLTPLDQL